MAVLDQAFQAHLEGGLTTLCRCWAITRRDGTRLGFTDHDRALNFEGVVFKANTGLSAAALQQGTGLSVDNSEAVGLLQDAAVTEEDITAGRYDGAQVRAWIVNWSDPEQRSLRFRGTLGELQRAGGSFQAELRGLSDALNRPMGRIYQKPCTAVLGDQDCAFALDTPGYSTELQIDGSWDGIRFVWSEMPTFEPAWFERGRLDVLSGDAVGLWSMIKSDRITGEGREIVLWEPIRAVLRPGDNVRLVAGCDKRMETCRLKFNNLLNYQGFPDLPNEDWVMAVPKRNGSNSGGSRR